MFEHTDLAEVRGMVILTIGLCVPLSVHAVLNQGAEPLMILYSTALVLIGVFFGGLMSLRHISTDSAGKAREFAGTDEHE